ncbi:MAG: hypothetical protein V3V08_17995, partial [Nannocystaceae bacterium]
MGIKPLSVCVGRGRWTLILLVTASVAASTLAGERRQRAAVTLASTCALRGLSRLAGLSAVDGGVRGEPLAVEVVQEGGSVFVRESVIASIDAVASLAAEPSPHLLQVEAVGEPDSVVLRYRLWRRGWSLRAPTPTWVISRPWLAMLAAGLGAGVLYAWRRVVLALLVAGLAAQLMVAAIPWPAQGVPRPGWIRLVEDGMLACAIDRGAEGLGDGSPLLLGAFALVCSVVAWLDHRRTRVAGVPGVGWVRALGLAALACLSLVAWVEAAARVGLFAHTLSWSMLAAWTCLFVAWGHAIRRVPISWSQVPPIVLVALLTDCTDPVWVSDAEVKEADSARTEGTLVPLPQLAPVARVSTRERWVDLIAQRVSASHVREDRLLVHFGSLAARKYLELSQHPPWRLGQEVAGRKAGVLVGQGGSLDIPVDGPFAPRLHADLDGIPQLAMAVTLRSLAPRQRVTVLWEDRPLANLTLSGRWERRTFSLPADLVRAGENRLRFYFRSVAKFQDTRAAAAVETVEIGARATIVAGPPQSLQLYTVHPDASGEPELTVVGGSSLVYYVTLPRRARIHIEASGAGELEVWASTDADHEAGRAPTRLLSAKLHPRRRIFNVDATGYNRVPTRL